MLCRDKPFMKEFTGEVRRRSQRYPDVESKSHEEGLRQFFPKWTWTVNTPGTWSLSILGKKRIKVLTKLFMSLFS